MEQFYTPKELADMLKVASPTIYAWIRDGQIQAKKFGRVVRIPAEEVQRILREGIKEKGNEEQKDFKLPALNMAA